MGDMRREIVAIINQVLDPFVKGVHLLLVTDRLASKGASLTELTHSYGRGEKVIVAGDDLNDRSLFAVADVKIAMAHAPASLQAEADLIAPPTAQFGIIDALNKALHHGR